MSMNFISLRQLIYHMNLIKCPMATIELNFMQRILIQQNDVLKWFFLKILCISTEFTASLHFFSPYPISLRFPSQIYDLIIVTCMNIYENIPKNIQIC